MSLRDDPQPLVVHVDVSGIPATMALARAARDVVDHAKHEDGAALFDPQVPRRDLDALRAALEPIYPGVIE